MLCCESVTRTHLYLFDDSLVPLYTNMYMYMHVCTCMSSKSSKWKPTSTFSTRNATHLRWDCLFLGHQIGQTGKSLNSLDYLPATPSLGQQTSTNIHDIFISVLGPTLKSSWFKGKHFTKWISSKPFFFLYFWLYWNSVLWFWRASIGFTIWFEWAKTYCKCKNQDTMVPTVVRAKPCSFLPDLSTKKSRNFPKSLSHQSFGYYASSETISMLLLEIIFDVEKWNLCSDILLYCYFAEFTIYLTRNLVFAMYVIRYLLLPFQIACVLFVQLNLTPLCWIEVAKFRHVLFLISKKNYLVLHCKVFYF